MSSTARASSFVASATIAVFVATRHLEAGSGWGILWLAPVLGLIWFYDRLSAGVIPWLVDGPSEGSSPAWIVALLGWLLLLGLALLAAYRI